MMLSGNISDTERQNTMVLNGGMYCIACGEKVGLTNLLVKY